MRLPEFTAENSLYGSSEGHTGAGTGPDTTQLIYPAALCSVSTTDGCVEWECFRGRALM
jgi:hypothetical protein